MGSIDRRRHIRVDSLNLSFVCVDDKNTVLYEGMGRTLNVSESGILLETHFLIEPMQTVSLTIALEDELVDIKGKVIHSRSGKNNLYETGIQFYNIDPQTIQTLKKFIKLFNEQEQTTT